MRTKNTRKLTTHNRHLRCPMIFKPVGPHIGMYCQTHGTWIKWISQKDLAKLTR